MDSDEIIEFDTEMLTKKEIKDILQEVLEEIYRLRKLNRQGTISKRDATKAAAKWKSCDSGKWPAIHIYPRLLKSHDSLRKVALGYSDPHGGFQAVVFLWFKDTDAPVRVKDRRESRQFWASEMSDVEDLAASGT